MFWIYTVCLCAPFTGLPCKTKNTGAGTNYHCLSFPYAVKDLPKRNISRYAIVADYHIVAMEMLNSISEQLMLEFPGFQFEPFVDNSPIREVHAAVLAGIGVLGKNALLIHPQYGSYVFIGEIVTDLALEIKPKNNSVVLVVKNVLPHAQPALLRKRELHLRNVYLILPKEKENFLLTRKLWSAGESPLGM